MADTLATQGPRPSITIDTLCAAPPPALILGADTRLPSPAAFGWAPNHHFAKAPGRRPYGPAFTAVNTRVLQTPPMGATSNGNCTSTNSSNSSNSSNTVGSNSTNASYGARCSSSPGSTSTPQARAYASTSPVSATSSSPCFSRSSSSRSASRKPAAMPGRPAGNKRPSSSSADDVPGLGLGLGSGAGGKLKLPRLDRGREDFSSVVKNRLQSYTRTGQACDRCKVRKIRCDALPQGCSHCANLSLECYVTDRVTGRTERRGYMQELEREKTGMISHIRDLERLLQDKGVEVQPWQSPVESADNPVGDASSWSQLGSVFFRNASPPTVASASSFAPPILSRSNLESRPQESHIGVAQDTAPLSSIGGTRLSILGTYIDTASFEAPDVDEPPGGAQVSSPLYNKSVQAFLQSSMRVNPAIHVDLPPRQDAFTYAEWYFLTVSTFVPILHQPSFMRLLTRIYDEPDFKPSASELVIVHMLIATILFQYAVRNWQQVDQRNQFNEQSNKHYHFALSKIYDLLCSQDVASVQAMAMIASHTRAFPKPGCGSLIANLALQRAIDFNLHRSPMKTGEGTNLQKEMHKRTWWIILMVVVAITGRRGCPIPISVYEFDTEFPEPIADELLTDEGVDTSQTMPCPFAAGLAGIKITPIFMQMYSNIYSVRRNAANYVNVVNSLERQLQEWEAELPDSLKLPESGRVDHSNIAAFYVSTFQLELRLCLRHPSVAMTTDKMMMAENSRICEEVARGLLNSVHQILKMKSLDTTWYQTSVYAAGIFSMLVACWERRFDTTPEQVAELRQDMDIWMAILKETSGLLGSGPGLTTQMKQIIDRTIGWIEHDMQNQSSKEPLAAPVAIKREQLPQTQAYQTTQQIPEAQSGATQSNEPSKGYYQELGLGSQAPYPSLAYGDQAQSSAGPSAYQATMFYNTTPQQDAVAVAAAAAAAVPAASATNPLVSFVSQAPQHATTQASAEMMWHSRGNPWHDWTAAIAGTQDQERYSANALLTLGGGARGSVPSQALTDATVGHPTGDLGLVPHGGQWPLIVFDNGATSGP